MLFAAFDSAFLLLVVAVVSEVSAAVTSFEVEAFSEVCLDSVVFSAADLNEALVGILAAAAAVSVLLAALLGGLLPAAGLLSGLTGSVLPGLEVVGVLLTLSFVVLGSEVGLAGGVSVLAFADT